MQRRYLKFILPIAVLFISASQLFAMDCVFFGTINNRKVKTNKCKIEKAGTQPYILAQVSDGRKSYAVDFSAISSRPGRKYGYVKILHFPKGKPMVSYSARGTMDVKVNANAKNALYSKVDKTLQDRSGNTMKINGAFTWYTSAMPKGPVTGMISQRFGSVNCKAAKAKLTPWNDGYRLQVLFIVKGGETANTTIDFPSDKSGTYSGKKVSMQIMHFTMKNGKMSSDFLNKKSLKVTVKKINGRKFIKYKGTLKGSRGIIPVSGKFIE